MAHAAADQRETGARYSAIAMSLHWLIALLIFTQIGLGWYFNEVLPDHSKIQDQVQDIHVSIGLTTLILIVVRIGVRLVVPAPTLPADLPAWESLLARVMHVLFYVLMLVLPLSGWLFLTVRHAPIPFWGLNWPSLPGLESVTGPAHKAFSKSVKHFHVYTQIWAAVAMIALHVAGALKHQFISNDDVVARMIPFLSRRRAASSGAA